MDDEGAAAPAPPARRDRHIDAGPALGKQVPEDGGAEIAQRRGRPTAKDSSEEAAPGRQRRPAYRVDALVHAMKAPIAHAPPNREVADTELQQLDPRDHSVLPLGESHDL